MSAFWASEEYLRRSRIAQAGLDKAIEALREAATTGVVGDGRIFVSELTHVIQIRSGKIDAAADAL